jgi:hypothetical protein
MQAFARKPNRISHRSTEQASNYCIVPSCFCHIILFDGSAIGIVRRLNTFHGVPARTQRITRAIMDY